MPSTRQKILDTASDALEKCSSPSSRAGNLVERVGKMDAKKVPHQAIAATLTARSTMGKVYTVQHVELLRDIYLESRTKVLVTARQATALIDDCRNYDLKALLAPGLC